MFIKQHKGHGHHRRNALAFNYQNIAKKYLNIWFQEFKTSKEERMTIHSARESLSRFKKFSLIRAWRNVTLKLQLKEIQEKTAQHIFRQRYLKLSFIGLRLLADFRMNERRLNKLSKENNLHRLLRKTLTGF